MDWEKVKRLAALSNIAAFVLYVIWFAYTIWVASAPATNQSLPIYDRGIQVRNVVASIVIIGFLLSAAIINLLAAFMSRRKLKTQVAELTTTNEKLAKDLSTANSAFRDMEEQVEKLRGHLTASEHNAKQANLRALQEIKQKDEFYKLHKESERKLAELAWLSKRANEQAKDISAHVVIKKVKLCALNLTASPRCIIVALTIRNESIFDITIRAKKLTGCIFFNNKSREESARIQETHRSAIENLEPKQEEILVVEQPLLKSEAETITEALDDANARFWLGQSQNSNLG